MSTYINIEHSRLRPNLYGLLGALLVAPPAAETLELLSGFRTTADLEGPLACCWQDLCAAATHLTPAQIDDEYHRLFIGLGRGEVIPYGSWYLAGHLMDKPLAKLRGDLAGLGIERRPKTPETEDHVAALCETMALLSAPDAPDSRRCQRKFYSRHMAPWMTRFFKDLQNAPSAHFYRAVGRMGEALMSAEKIYFNKLQTHEQSPGPLSV